MFGGPIAFDGFTLIFIELAIGLFLAVILGSIARLLRQPLILAYILTGALISILGLVRIGEETLPLFGSLGVAFLLFLVGIELRISDLRQSGKQILYLGLGQLIFTSIAGFAILKILRFSNIEALYLAVALTFASTIIIVKLLTEKKDLNSLYGKMVIGLLLIQDFAAIMALIFISGFQLGNGGLPSLLTFVGVLIRGLVLFIATFFLNRLILPPLFRYTAASSELLFITAISWCFIFASFAKVIGFSFEIGAFLAGLAIASSPFHLQISAKIRPLRDFFVVIFFIFLGTSITFTNINSILIPTIVLSLFVLIGNPLIVLIVMGLMGQRKRTSFLASVTVAQVSEFSLIMIAAGQRIGHVSQDIVSLVALVGVITITISSYMITYSNWLYKKLSPFLSFFEKKSAREALTKFERLEDHVILIGCEQMGRDLLQFFKNKGLTQNPLIVVDFNPLIISSLQADGINAIYGDVGDTELLEELNIEKARLLISTITDFDDDIFLINFAKQKGILGPVIVTSYWAKDAIKFYEAGADYVVVPELVGGDHTARVLSDHWHDLDKLKGARERNMSQLIEISRAVGKTG